MQPRHTTPSHVFNVGDEAMFMYIQCQPDLSKRYSQFMYICGKFEYSNQ